MLNSNPPNILSTSNPFITYPIIIIIIAFIINKNSPNVRIVNGIVKNINIGFAIMFNIANSIATTISMCNFL